jgi:glucosamine-6-phosphate deaminase
MQIRIAPDRDTMSQAAAAHAAAAIKQAIALTGNARIVVATGASQLAFLAALAATPGVDWGKVEMFHLDEYVGLPETHPASFRRYLRENLIDKVGIARVHLLDVDVDPQETARRVGAALSERPVDVACVGIGENAHLAFNDPPADFDTAESYIIVSLDRACRAQQVGEGWFKAIEDVPETAVSMSVRQILSAREIVVVVPDVRKAAAVQAAVEGPIDPSVPASALRLHPHVTLYLDEAAASQLRPQTRAAAASGRGAHKPEV